MEQIDSQKKSSRDDIVIKISEDNMQAYINLCPLDTNYNYTVDQIQESLSMHKVIYGIKENVIKEILDGKKFYLDILIAQGIICRDGTDGFFEFLFNTAMDRKPKILKDGSVDYNSMGDIEVVEVGSEIVRYHPATKGENGISVSGIIISCKNGKDLTPIKGKGFNLSEDKQIYTATIAGKVDYENNKLTVSNLLVVEGDVTHSTGNIEFSGDVNIKGSVYTGMIVKAYGNLSVDGHVEAAILTAGKDIVLKNGMQGAGKGTVNAGGSVSGKFFEQTTIRCKGNINANAMLNCDVRSDAEVIISGKLGIIVGGVVFARKEICATIVGNVSEIKTKLIVGSEKDLVPEVIKIENDIEQLDKEIAKLDAGIEQISLIMEKNKNPGLIEKKRFIIRAKIEKEAELSVANAQKEEIVVNIEKAVHSKLVVKKNIYPGTKININGSIIIIGAENYNVAYHRQGMDIVAVPNI